MDLRSLMQEMNVPSVVARPVPEGTIPLIAVEGPAYECGRQYAEITLQRYPGFREYLDHAEPWQHLAGEPWKLIEKHAPHMPDVFRGIFDVAGPPRAKPKSAGSGGGCTGFAVSGSVTLDGHPIAGQTKDTGPDRVPRYIALRMKIYGAPSILALCYPGEVMGYGMWSTGMVLTRHSMYSKGGNPRAPMPGNVLQYLAFSCGRVEEVAELYAKYAGGGPGGNMWMDRHGNAVSIDITRSAIGMRWMKDGVLTRSNHPESAECAADEAYPFPIDGEDTKYRTRGLYDLFHRERGRISVQKAIHIMADHTMYPCGPCKHWHSDGNFTTCLVVSEPTLGRIHVVRGQPCCNWPVTYAL